VIITFILLINFIFVFNVAADDEIETVIDAYFNIDLQSATDLVVDYEIYVTKIMLSVGEETYSGTDILEISNTNQVLLGAISQEINILVNGTLSDTFKNARIKSLQVLPDYVNGKFTGQFKVNLTSGFFRINESINAEELVNGMLDMDARLDYNFNLTAKQGWDNTYTFDLGDTYTFKSTDGKIDGDSLEWKVLNSEGENSVISPLLIIYKKNPSSTSTVEDVFLRFNLDSRQSTTELKTDVIIRNLSINKYQIIPSFISNLNNITADGVRLFVKNNLITWDEIFENTIQPIKDEVIEKIQTPVFNQSIDLSFKWDNATTFDCENPYEINDMNSQPEIISDLSQDKINLNIMDISSKSLYGIINSGATANVSLSDNKINFGDKLISEGLNYPYEVRLLLPENITLDGYNEYIWDEDSEFKGIIKSNIEPSYEKEVKSTKIIVDIQSTDLNLFSFFTGNSEFSFGMQINQRYNFNVTDLTNIEKYFKLPQGINLHKNLLLSDVFRLCVQENVFSNSDINSYLNDQNVIFENRMRNILSGLQISGNINRGVFDDSLVWDGDISDMDSKKAIKTSYEAYCNYPVSFDFSFLLPSVTIPSQNFNFTGLKNQTVVYEIIFPKGIDIELSDPYAKSVIKTTDDDRKYISITFNSSESNLSIEVSCKINPSALFFLGLFTPCILSIIITLLLIFVVLYIRKKRRIRRSRAPPESSSYEDEDYYIPPPPNSKK